MSNNIHCNFCNHFHTGTPSVCTLLSCDCVREPTAHVGKSDSYHQQVLSGLREMDEKIGYMLTEIDGMRNQEDWAFVVAYWHYNLGFCTGMEFSSKVYNQIRIEGNPESIRRCRQKVCHHELTALLEMQKRLDELLEGQVKGLENVQYEYAITRQKMEDYVKKCELIPTSMELLTKKGVKMGAFVEHVTE